MRSLSVLARRRASVSGFTLVDSALLVAAAAVVITISADKIAHPEPASLRLPGHVEEFKFSPAAPHLAQLPALAAAAEIAPLAKASRLELPESAPASVNPADLEEITKRLGIADLESDGGLVANVHRSVEEWMARIDSVLAVQRELSGMPAPAASARR